MHLVQSDRITVLPEISLGGFRFIIPALPKETTVLDTRDILRQSRNESVDPRPDPKLWSAVYPVAIEYDAFERGRAQGVGIFIGPISCARVIETARDDYFAHGYFVEALNRFVVPDVAPYRLGVAIENLLYSYKDVYSYSRVATTVPPLREPSETRACIAGVNAGIISRILVPENDELAVESVRKLARLQKIAFRTLAQTLVRPIGASALSVDIFFDEEDSFEANLEDEQK